MEKKLPFLPSLEQSKAYIYSVDLNTTLERLIHIEKWSKKHAFEACEQYRNYLFLQRKYGQICDLPPSVDIDEVWHAHILHTEDYIEFCEKVFGAYLHHHPHHGKENIITQQQLEQTFEEQTQRLYHLEFDKYI